MYILSLAFIIIACILTKSAHYTNITHSNYYSKSQKIHNALKLHFIYHGRLPSDMDQQCLCQSLGLTESDMIADNNETIQYRVLSNKKIQLAYLDIYNRIDTKVEVDDMKKEFLLNDFSSDWRQDNNQLSIEHTPITIGNVKIYRKFQILDSTEYTKRIGVSIPVRLQHIEDAKAKGVIQFEVQCKDLDAEIYKKVAYTLNDTTITYDQLLSGLYPSIQLSTEISEAKILEYLERQETNRNRVFVDHEKNIFYNHGGVEIK